MSYQYLPSRRFSITRRFNFRYLLFVIFILCFIGTLGFLLIKHTRTSNAVSYANFKAGNIMSDAVMSNYNSMSEGDINNFMHSKNPCNDTNLGKVGHYLSLGIYHVENGHFVCLADEVFDGETVPHIIASVAREYRINPQVILVLLEKEQGLISDTYPYHNQMAYAFGYGCDDTVGCHSEYAGFRKQVSHAAALFREVLDGGWTNYPIGWNYVKYHPNSACGGTNVYIENYATSALYRYTPYQPNSAALAAGYGTGDACSSYGNRNFYGLFTDWFGSTQKSFSPSDLGNIYLEDGTYSLYTGIGTTLDIKDNNIANGTPVQTWKIDGGASQIFHIRRQSDGFYTITNAYSGKAIDVPGASTVPETRLHTYDSNQTCAQKWAITNHEGRYVFRNACSGNMLAVDGHPGWGASVVTRRYTSEDSLFEWDLVRHDAAPIANNTFNALTAAGQALDISSAGTADGSNVQIFHKNDTVAQLFRFERTTDGYYMIINPHSGKVVDVSGAGTSNGTNIHIYTRNNTCAQKWIIQPSNDGYYFIRNACSGSSIDVNPIEHDYSNARIWQYNGTIAQKWNLVQPLDQNAFLSGGYNLYTAAGQALDISSAGTADGSNVQIFHKNDTVAQLFRFERTTDGYYMIINPHSGKVVDVSGAGTSNGTNIHIYTRNNTCAQKWIIQPSNDGYYFIRNACSGSSIDVNPIEHDYSNARIWQYNGTIAQKWRITKVTN